MYDYVSFVTTIWKACRLYKGECVFMSYMTELMCRGLFASFARTRYIVLFRYQAIICRCLIVIRVGTHFAVRSREIWRFQICVICSLNHDMETICLLIHVHRKHFGNNFPFLLSEYDRTFLFVIETAKTCIQCHQDLFKHRNSVCFNKPGTTDHRGHSDTAIYSVLYCLANVVNEVQYNV